MLKKRNLLFLSLLILGILLLSSCFLNPPVAEGILKGQVLVPDGTTQTKDLTGQALPDATVNIIDLSTDAIIATTTTDATGYYQVAVPPGGPYLLEAVKDGVKLEQITCQVEVGMEYDLGTADCVSTAAALIAQAMMDAGDNPADIDCADIIADPNFDDVSSIVCATIQAGGDPTASAAVEQAVEDFLNPSTPAPTATPAPAPTPTYSVTFDKNDAAATGTMAAQTIASGSSANLRACGFAKTGWTFTGWSTTSDGDVVYADEESYTMGSENVTLFAKWTINTYTVTYNGNGNTVGSVPEDPSYYGYGITVTVLGNTGNLTRMNDGGISYRFTGWNTSSTGNEDTNVGATFIMGSENEILYAQWTPYVLSDAGPAGGYIFYDKGSVSDGWRYLEAAPQSTEWTEKEWGKYETEVGVTAQGTDVGTGKANTMAIVAKLNEDPPDSDRAAQLCDALEVNGYSDWFLPSKGELDLMYTNLHDQTSPVGGLDDVYYWSSSEGSADHAWSKNFFFNSSLNGYKYNAFWVRAIRAF